MRISFVRISTIILSCMIFGCVGAFAEGKNISIILSSDFEPFIQSANGFKQSVGEKNLGVNITESNLKAADPAAVTSQVAQTKPVIIYAVGTDAIKLAKAKFNDTQIVFSMVLNPAEFIDANTTGVSLALPPELKIRNMKKILPFIKNIGIIYSAGSDPDYKELSAEADNQGLKIIGKKISTDSDFPDALAALIGQMDCFMMVADSKVYFSQSVKYLLLDSLKNKFPVIGLSSFYTKAGALLSFDCDYEDIGKQAGDIAVKILNGEKAAEIKALRPRKIKYSINSIVADRMQINISAQAKKDASEIFN